MFLVLQWAMNLISVGPVSLIHVMTKREELFNTGSKLLQVHLFAHLKELLSSLTGV